MELKRRFDFRKIITLAYVCSFAVYIFVGLTPVDATQYEISGQISIPSIALNSDVTTLTLVDHKLNTPDTIVGSYVPNDSKIFLVGHSASVFKDLDMININDNIYYNGKTYEVVSTEIFAKNDINMNKLLEPTLDHTLVIMTCAGTPLRNGDATHRLIVIALEK